MAHCTGCNPDAIEARSILCRLTLGEGQGPFLYIHAPPLARRYLLPVLEWAVKRKAVLIAEQERHFVYLKRQARTINGEAPHLPVPQPMNSTTSSRASSRR